MEAGSCEEVAGGDWLDADLASHAPINGGRAAEQVDLGMELPHSEHQCSRRTSDPDGTTSLLNRPGPATTINVNDVAAAERG